jgi:ABC-type xylose transport system permease subunit
MSFREKSAWVTLIALIVLSIAFMLHLPLPWSLRPEPSGFMFQVLLLLIGSFIVIEIVAYVGLASLSFRDARAPKDERELLIELKSTRVSAFLYSVSSMVALFLALHIVFANIIGVAYLLLVCFVFSQIVKYAMRVYYYRRGV